MPKPTQKIKMLPSVGKPDVKLAAELLLPLLESFMRNKPDGKPTRRIAPGAANSAKGR
jgi:hypothetical protein